MVRSPVTLSFPGPSASVRFDLNVSVGNFAASKKLGLRRSLSRISTRVSTELASMVTSISVLPGLAGSVVTLSVIVVKAPLYPLLPGYRNFGIGLLHPIGDENVGLVRHFAVAVGGPHQPLAVGGEHGESVEVGIERNAR